MKDTKTVLLAMVSVGLVATWAFHLYDKSHYSKQGTRSIGKDSAVIAQKIKDSMQRVYSLALDNLGAQLDSTKNTASQLKDELNSKLEEIYQLRSEISNILKNKNVKKEGLDLARNKTATLQQLVTKLQNRNNTIEEEKKQIQADFAQVNNQVMKLEGDMQQLTKQNKAFAEDTKSATTFVVSDLRISPVMVTNEKEVETNLALKASKLVVSFDLQNKQAQLDNAEVFVVVKQPDGKVLNTDVWETNSMETNGGIKMDYTRRMKFDYQKGETKHLLFSINADDYQKGNYSLLVYHNGYKIGQTTKALN